MSNEIQRHERYKQYAYNAYHLGDAKFPIGTKVLGVAENPKTGFSGYVLQEENRIVIIYKGTDSFKKLDEAKKDYSNDANMAFRKRIPEQTKDALEVYDKVKQAFPNVQIDVVGHSLGGSLAQYVAIMRNVNEAVCFNPVGIGKSMNDYLSKYGSKTPKNKVINYNNPNDGFTKYFRGELYGTNYTINEIDKNGNKHTLENMKPLSTRQKAGVGVNKKGKSHTTKGCVGSYPVNGYTRANGTEVKGYTRHCGAKHSANNNKNNNRLNIASTQKEPEIIEDGGCWGVPDIVMHEQEKQKIFDKYKNKQVQNMSKSELNEFLKAYFN